MIINRRDFVRTAILAAVAASVSAVIAATQADRAMWIELSDETYQEWEIFRASVVRMHREYGEIQLDHFGWMLSAGRSPDEMYHVTGAKKRNGKTFLKLGCHKQELHGQDATTTLRNCQAACIQLTATGVIQ